MSRSHVDLVIEDLLRITDEGRRQFDFPYEKGIARVSSVIPFEDEPYDPDVLKVLVNNDLRVVGIVEVGAIIISVDGRCYLVSARSLFPESEASHS